MNRIQGKNYTIEEPIELIKFLNFFTMIKNVYLKMNM